MPSTVKRKRSAAKRGPSRDKVRAHRERLRAQGLRPIQIWVPDTRAPAFAAEARRQSRRVAASPRAAEDQAFVDAISEFGSE
jgi:hypothetical protein